MAGNPAAAQPQPSPSQWSSRAEVYHLPVFMVVSGIYWAFFLHSDLGMAAYTAAIICYSLTPLAIGRRYIHRVSRRLYWIMRAAAAVTGYWLFEAAHSNAYRVAIITLFAVTYVACEWTLRRHIREHRSTQPDIPSAQS